MSRSETDQIVTSVDSNRDVNTLNRTARDAALAAVGSVSVQATSLVSYRSRGTLVIIGPPERALPVADSLEAKLSCCVLATVDSDPMPDRGFPVFFSHGRPVRLTGHLGEFALSVLTDSGEVNVAGGIESERRHFDLVLDLGVEPLLDLETPPFGYYAPRDSGALEQALAELPELVGDFEKPKYFHYDADICAHGRRGLHGCRRCIEACPAGAITSLVEKIQIDPYYCQGGGSCATVCPTGAIVYRYPQPADTLNRLRVLLHCYRDNGGREPVVLFHDAESGAERVARLAERLPERVIPLEFEELGSVGMEVWLAALAFGANRVLLLDTPRVPERVRRALDEQLGIARALLIALDYPADVVSRVAVDHDDDLSGELRGTEMPFVEPAGFAGGNEKRRTIFHAVDHLAAQVPQTPKLSALPEGAPFGEIQVDQSACTLCMACVSVCPASALYDGADTPRLDFVEMNCVQCGLCEIACPENAIARQPRFLFEPEARRRKRTLNEEQPFHCIACGAPFATRSMIELMQSKLQGHSMFQDPATLRRLKMCGDCRVRDMFEDERRV